jgi:hypothetical protein
MQPDLEFEFVQPRRTSGPRMPAPWRTLSPRQAPLRPGASKARGSLLAGGSQYGSVDGGVRDQRIESSGCSEGTTTRLYVPKKKLNR